MFVIYNIECISKKEHDFHFEMGSHFFSQSSSRFMQFTPFLENTSLIPLHSLVSYILYPLSCCQIVFPKNYDYLLISYRPNVPFCSSNLLSLYKQA